MEKTIDFSSTDEQLALFGPHDRHLRRIRDHYGIRCVSRGGRLMLDGGDDDVLDAYVAVLKLMELVRRGETIDDAHVEQAISRVSGLGDGGAAAAGGDRGASGRVASRDRGGNGGRRDSGRARQAGASEMPPTVMEADSAARRLRSNNRERPSDGHELPKPLPLTDEERRSGKPRTLRAEQVLGGDINVAQALTAGQARYVQAMRAYDVVFAIGPAGTGKTFLATAMAVDALNRGVVRKIVLVRPAVEAGEKLGYLPGDYQAKINPYLRPVFDALGALLDYGVFQRYLERDVVEIAPLAYMRGRTLENAFIILDEAQNTTPRQMMMFLTRFGRNSRVVVTGDVTQVDLGANEQSGLLDAERVLQSLGGVGFVYLGEKDVVRHSLVQRIIEAYETSDNKARLPFRPHAPYDRDSEGDSERDPKGDSERDSEGDSEGDPARDAERGDERARAKRAPTDDNATVSNTYDEGGSDSSASVPPPADTGGEDAANAAGPQGETAMPDGSTADQGASRD